MLINDTLLDIEDVKKSRLPLIDLFIRRTAVITSTQESLVEKIVKDQWNQANKKTSPHSSIGEIDFPNLGTFYMSKAKGKRKISSLEKASTTLGVFGEFATEEQIKKNMIQIQRNNTNIKNIKDKTKTNGN